MNATAWLIRDSTGDLLTAYWSRDAADEYIEDHDAGAVIERLTFEVGA